MTEAEAVEAISAHFVDGWSACRPDVPIGLDNEQFDSVTTFATLEIHHETRRQISAGSVGARRFEARGIITVMLHGSVDTGRAELAALADVVRSVLEGTRISVPGDSEPINTYAGATREIGADGAHWLTSVETPFVYYRVS